MSYRQKEYMHNEQNGGRYSPTKAQREAEERAHLQKPVKLQPSWEENNLPEDELNFKNLTMDDASLQVHTPPDKYHLVYITFLIHGMATLLPWNMFITAIDYFTGYKFSSEYIGYVFPHSQNFMQYQTFCAQVPNVLFNWINIFVQLGGDLTTRIVWSITVNVIIFVITVVLAMVDSSSWPTEFFAITLVTIIILNVANGIYQNTVYGMAAKLPPKYTGAIILGNNISGTFATIVDISTRATTSNKRMAAIYYFITALLVLLIGFDTYFALPLNRFYRHFELKEKKQKESQRRSQSPGDNNSRLPYLKILKQTLPQMINVWCIFFVTLATFPAISAGIQPSDTTFLGKYYTSVSCFLFFNVFAMIGSMLPSWFIWPSAKYLWIPVALRFLYIPFYLLCNFQPIGVQRALPVLIQSDWIYWTGAITMALTSGYFSSVAMMYVPRTVDPQYASTAGMFGGASLITGIFSGICVSFLWPVLVTHVGY